MAQSNTSNDDPAGERPLHEGLAHRPIVRVKGNGELVRFTPVARYPHSAETVDVLKKHLQGIVAIDGGMVRHPSGTPEDGTPTHAFPTRFAKPDDAAKIEHDLRTRLEAFASSVEGAEFLGFVDENRTALNDLLAGRPVTAHRDDAPHLRVVHENGDVTDAEPSDPTVDLHHPHASGHGQSRQGEGSGIGSTRL
jgi:hypothetical protein